MQLLKADDRLSTSIDACIVAEWAETQPIPVLLFCRVYALFVTDRVCAEPLTDAVHFNDLMHANPQHVEATARLLKSLALPTNNLYSEMQLLEEQPTPLERSQKLTLGVPYPLHNMQK